MCFRKNKITERLSDTVGLPVHIAIIPDGNRRWARKRGLASIFGHREGARRIKEITRFCSETGIKYISFYAFSTENWTRGENEVKDILGIILEFLKNADRDIEGTDIRMTVTGDIAALPAELQAEITRVEEKTSNNSGTVLNLFLNYGGRQEILDAITRICRSGVEKINAEQFREFLYRPELPDPDLIIRTSGELRVSNFLIWQNAYSELYFAEKLWPDFRAHDLEKAIEEYRKRNRRFGGR